MPRCLAAIAAFAFIGALPAAAAETMTIAVDKSRMVRLSHDAGVVMIANPEIADVAIESPRLVFVLGRAPGVTSLSILDDDGKTMVRSDVIVVPNSEGYVTMHRATTEFTFICVPRCAQVETPGGGANGGGGGGGT